MSDIHCVPTVDWRGLDTDVIVPIISLSLKRAGNCMRLNLDPPRGIGRALISDRIWIGLRSRAGGGHGSDRPDVECPSWLQSQGHFRWVFQKRA